MPQLAVSSHADAAALEEIEQSLLADLRESQDQSTNRAVNFVVRASDETIIAGLVGSLSYGWLQIKVLWVHSEHRGCGIGSNLIEQAAKSVKDIDGHAIWLDTSSLESLSFYKNMGFEIFGVLENTVNTVVPDHKRWFLKRKIDIAMSVSS